jgi:hypothetical protein
MVIRFINMEADLRVQYVSFPPPTSDFFGSKFYLFLGTKLGQNFLKFCFYSVMLTNFIIFWGKNWYNLDITRCASHHGLAIYIKNYLEAKEEL